MKNRFPFVYLLFSLVFQGYSQEKAAVYGKWTETQIDGFLEKSELIPIQITGEKDNRINIVIINQWTSSDEEPYNSPNMRSEFVKDIEESLIAALTYGDERAQTAYANYKDFFNIYGLWMPDVPEWKKGIDVDAVDAIRDKLFLPWKNEHTGWVTFLVMPNRDKGGGGAARNLEKRFGTAVIAGNGIGKMLHEISHTCMSLGDEYTTAATGTDAFPTYASDIEYERNAIKWRKWIEPSTPLPTPYEKEYLNKIGAFEGNQYHLVDYYRSTAQGCIMGAGVFDNTEEMCPICNQRVAMRVYDLVNPIKNISPDDTSIGISGKTTLSFSVDHIVPQPNTQKVTWLLNGKPIASGMDELEVEFGALSEYELICSIIDETSYIRPDPPYAEYPKFQVKWTIINNAPVSKAEMMKVEFLPKINKEVAKLVPMVRGGVPPYIYKWHNGSTGKVLYNIGVGIYDLEVTDSEYRKTKASYSIYESSLVNSNTTKNRKKTKEKVAAIRVDANIKASEVGKDNGSVSLEFEGGTPPYTLEWKDAFYSYGDNRFYEPENASIEASDYELKIIFSARNTSYMDFKGNEGSVTWNVEVANSGLYPIDVVYGGIFMKESYAKIAINGKLEDKMLKFNQTRPLYTGWDVSTMTVFLEEGMNKIALISNGQSLPNIDYLRVPTSVKSESGNMKQRVNLVPRNYDFIVKDSEGNMLKETVSIPEVYPFEINKIELESVDNTSVGIKNPLPGYTYKWYAKDISKVKLELYEEELASGSVFSPPKVGNYYVTAIHRLTKGESSNRIGFAVGDLANKRAVEISPLELEEVDIKLWLDATDIDGNGKTDIDFPERGPVKEWKDKTRGSSNAIFMKFEPNRLNGKGVAAFDHVWVSKMKKGVTDFQTIILVYKESSMSFSGTSLFRGLNAILGKSKNPEKALLDKEIIGENSNIAKVHLNGKKADPFSTPNPMDFCTLIVELESKSDAQVGRVEGLWEGLVAEMILLDRKLTDWERKGIEEHLRRKWFSTIDVKF